MRRRKHISFLLLFSFSVLVAHNSIPHHHHHEELKSFSCCDETHENQGDQNEHDNEHHCHAFNEISFFKTDSSYQQVKQLVFFLTNVLPADEFRLYSPYQDLNRYLPLKIPELHPDPVTIAPLRGPPSIA